MKKIITAALALTMLFSFTACGNNVTQDSGGAVSTAVVEENETTAAIATIEIPLVQIKESPDKYTWYIKNYIGKNCASFGYTVSNGNRKDEYGNGSLEVIFLATDGSFIDTEDEELLKEYVVIGQNLAPNTEMKYTYFKDEEGNELAGVATQSFDEIVLCVKKVGANANTVELTPINPAPDKYTRYIADYVGRNLAGCGYTNLSGVRTDLYSEAAFVKLVIIAKDGSFIDPTDENSLKNYVVTAQNIAPNTELKLTFYKDDNGNELAGVETKNIEEIELYVIPASNLPNGVTSQSNNSVSEKSKTEESTVQITEAATVADANKDKGLRPEFKKAMDDYEAFYDDYCEFLIKYKENPTDPKLLTESLEMLEKVDEMDENFGEWEDNDLNDAEFKYYLEVTNRILEKMVDAM